MKRTDFKAKSSVFYLGKGIIILSLVITSSLGFVLGFFVGRSMHSSPQEYSSAIMPLDVAEQPNVRPAEEILSPEQLPPREVQQAEIHDVQDSEVQKPAIKNPEPERKTDQTKADRLSPKEKTAKAVPSNKEVPKNTAKQEISKTRKYTVQAGAFNNPDEADALKSALAKKGFRAFTVETKAKNNKVLHKVMVGEYKTRKEAEVLSLKLKKSEGLKTFVTIRAE